MCYMYENHQVKEKQFRIQISESNRVALKQITGYPHSTSCNDTISEMIRLVREYRKQELINHD
jgi:hypothetical protein